MKCYGTRFYDYSRGRVTELIYVDQFGRHVPLLDETGTSVNFERSPGALERAVLAMTVMDTIFDRDEDDDI